MHGFLLVRAVFAAVVVYSAVLIRPIEGHGYLSAGLGFAFATLIVLVEARLRDTAVTSLLGGLLGFGVGLAIASAIGQALFWADTTNSKVRFMHSLILLVLPYLGGVLGARKGEWLE